MQDPFEDMSHTDFLEALDMNNWTEVDRLHTPTFEAILQNGELTLVFPDSQRRTFKRSEVEALTRFLDQYAGVEPLPPPDESAFADWQPTRVDLDKEEDEE